MKAAKKILKNYNRRSNGYNTLQDSLRRQGKTLVGTRHPGSRNPKKVRS